MFKYTFAFTLALLLAAPALAEVRAEISLSDQRLRVFVDGGLKHEWQVSTARRGYRTPVGSYQPIRLERKWFSRKYHWSPMPHSVFFYGGYAIHGTTDLGNLGKPASHGCVRLHPDNAATLFELVRKYGMKNTRILVMQ